MRMTPLLALLLVTTTTLVAQNAPSVGPPPKWNPDYWKQALDSARVALELDRRDDAEKWCWRGLMYVDDSVATYLGDFADLLAKENDERAARGRSNAQAYAELNAAHRQMRSPPNSYLGFIPDDELKKYADLLHQLEHEPDAVNARALAVAYRQAQTAQVNRAL